MREGFKPESALRVTEVQAAPDKLSPPALRPAIPILYTIHPWPVALSQSILTLSNSWRRKPRGHFPSHSPSALIPLATFAKPFTSVSLAIHNAASAHLVPSPVTPTTNNLSCFQNAIFAATARPAPWHTHVRFIRNLKPQTMKMCMAKTSGVNSAVVGDSTTQSRNGRL